MLFSFLVNSRINENCLLVDLGLYLNPQDPTGICLCLIKCKITAKMFLTLKEETYCIQKAIFSLTFSELHASLC